MLGDGSSCSRSITFGIEPLDQRIEFARHVADIDCAVLSVVWNVAPQTCCRVLLAEIAEELHEARDEVGLGEQRIDREVDLEPLVQFKQPGADGVGIAR